ncbi:MAG: hypothetical protein L6Q70_16030, partial [Thauera sp.]|nr:hypothetical protein [Thauera sp.]
PVDPAALYTTLIQWLPRHAPAPAPAAQPEPASSAPAAVPAPAVPDGPEPDIRTRLEQVPGLDVAYGLKNLRGRVSNYLRLLHKFADG